MKREVIKKIQGFRTKDGAGVNLVRVLGHETVEDFDPILMLDSFDSTNPDEYTAGFPMHPHRGIETVSYLSQGKMIHKDTLGNEDAIGDGEVQWMNSGSGIEHEEMVPAADRLLGVQLWLNLPQKEKMSKPTYRKIRKDEIEEIDIDGGMIRLIAGSYKDHHGFKGEHLPLDYYDIHLEPYKEFKIETNHDKSIMIFTLIGDVYVGDEHIEEKTAAKLSEGDMLAIKTGENKAQILFMSSDKLGEEVAWAGPIVMNTSREIRQAFEELNNGTFIKESIEFNAE
ncbi:MAG: pirin family protein [Clostridiales bacterium]|uniref:pirin family protein n=1 Tax=Peptostreptococcus porci TaxID=2652282 RepID=UPI0029D54673|nr:pirin family protein [Peptostreptococcus porci]MCI5698696.1 pirin family protein [Clostridiales bacterium]MDD7347272.1 pirin family protein [Clostridiales bacterium]MDY4129009.1 pirin family protein [Peptostreptococcus porci]